VDMVSYAVTAWLLIVVDMVSYAVTAWLLIVVDVVSYAVTAWLLIVVDTVRCASCCNSANEQVSCFAGIWRLRIFADEWCILGIDGYGSDGSFGRNVSRRSN